MVQFESGKYYRTVDGRRFGPAILNNEFGLWQLAKDDTTPLYYNERSQGRFIGSELEHPNCDLVAEWSEPSINTKTVTVVPNQVVLNLEIEFPGYSPVATAHLPNGLYTADELRAHAATLTELARIVDGV